MKLSDKQAAIVKIARENNNIVTKKQCVELLDKHYYYNGSKYIGDILSNMVNKKILKRIKPGVFELKTTVGTHVNGSVTNDQAQITLF